MRVRLLLERSLPAADQPRKQGPASESEVAMDILDRSMQLKGSSIWIGLGPGSVCVCIVARGTCLYCICHSDERVSPPWARMCTDANEKGRTKAQWRQTTR